MPEANETQSSGVQSHTYTSEDGLALHYFDYAGAGRMPVLCMHGVSRNARDFRDVAPHLAKSRRVICPDFRGRGASEWDKNPGNYDAAVYVKDILLLLNHLDLSRVIVIGTSLGGIVGTGLVQTNPDLVAGIVLNDIGPVIDPAGLTRIASYVGRDPQWPDWESAAAALKERNTIVHPNFTDDDWLDFAEKSCRMNEDGIVVQDYDPAVSKSLGTDVAGVDLWPLFECLESLPALLLRGALSDLLSVQTAEDVVQRLPNLSLVTVPNCGHVPTLGEAESLKAIDDFVSKVDAHEL